MSRGTVDPERSNHNRMVSADVDWVVTRRIWRTKIYECYVRTLTSRSMSGDTPPGTTHCTSTKTPRVCAEPSDTARISGSLATATLFRVLYPK